MPTIDPYAGTPEGFNEGMWKEAVGSFKPSGEDVFNARSGEASLVGYIPAQCLKAAMRFMLGYEQVQVATPSLADGELIAPGLPRYVLCRKNPVRHPYYEELWCNGCAPLEFKPITPYIPGEGRQLRRPARPVLPRSPQPLYAFAGYASVKLMLRFAPSNVTLLEDSDTFVPTLSANRWEYMRNTVKDWEPRVETFDVKVQWKFAEGENCPPPFSNPKGNTAVAERSQIIVKPDLVVRWERVPAAWLLDSDSEKPTNLLNALGCVNSADFFKLPKGTLLFLGAKMQRNPWTLRPSGFNPFISLESKYTYDLELLFSFFDPVKGFSGSTPARLSFAKGHNNFPYRGSGVVTPGTFPAVQDPPGSSNVIFAGGTGNDPQAMKWFFATTDGTVGNAEADAAVGAAVGTQTLFQYTDFARIFDCASNTTFP